MDAETIDKNESLENSKETANNEGEDLSEDKKVIGSKEEDQISQYKESRKPKQDEGGENSASDVELLRQAESNWGMQFADSAINNSTIIVNNMASPKCTTGDTKNLLGETSEEDFLKWCSEHYRDFHFSMLLAICILDRQPYQTIYQMARELQDIFKDTIAEEKEEKSDWIFKSHIAEVLGIVKYSDITYVRKVKVEVEFLRLPFHEQAEHYIQLMVKEFSELKYILTEYLTKKIDVIYGSKHNFTVISGCMEALAFIGATDLQFFNDQIILGFLKKKDVGMDYCLSVLLGKLYRKKECRDFVKACVVQWGQLRNNPHDLLVSLYVCSILGKQETLVRDIWMNVLERLSEELLRGESWGNTSHIDILRELFKSGNRNISYHKGVIHAFYKMLMSAERKREWEKYNLLNSIFLLFVFEDYISCNVSGNKPGRRDMIWISILRQLDEQTGKELISLWEMVLDNREHPGEGWKLLEGHLAEYKNYKEEDIERLSFFFYHMNKKIGGNRSLFFLKECAQRHPHSMKIANQIYIRIKE